VEQEMRFLPSALDTVRKVYAFWGKRPLLYAASDCATFLCRPGAGSDSTQAAGGKDMAKKEESTKKKSQCGTGKTQQPKPKPASGCGCGCGTHTPKASKS
jgi:hypothetical protein